MVKSPWSKTSISLIDGAPLQVPDTTSYKNSSFDVSSELSVLEIIQKEVPSLSPRGGGYKSPLLVAQYVKCFVNR